MKKNKKGFTMVEILVVIILISLIATMIVPKMLTSIDEQKVKVTGVKIASLEGVLQKFYLDCERYPDDSEGLEALLQRPSGLEEKWRGPYVKPKELLDAWDNPFVYIANASNVSGFIIISYGSDKAEGGEGHATDITNE